MLKLLIISCTALMLAACGATVPVEPKDATPKGAKFQNLKVKSLNKEALKALGKKADTDLIVMLHSDGTVTMYGSAKHGFVDGNQKSVKQTAKKYGKSKKTRVVHDIRIKMTRNSPVCYSYKDGAGNLLWWPEDCPHN